MTASVRRLVPAAPEVVWSRVTDVVRHGPFVPLTTIRTKGDLGLGESFVARTGLGPLGFDDPMSITAWSPPPADPARMRLVKTGRVLGGWAEITVRAVPDDPGLTEVVWTEEISPRVPLRPRRLVRRVDDGLTRLMLARVLDGLLADLPTAGPGA